MFKFLRNFALFMIVLAIASELVFHFVVPAATFPAPSQNQIYGIMQYSDANGASGLYTDGRRAENKAHWRVNNMGWLSAKDYLSPEETHKPSTVIIGNSYVEAVYLDVDRHLSAQAEQLLGNGHQVMSLGAWGVDLLQGIKVARYAHEELDPDLVVFVVTNGSLRRSVRNLAHRPLCLQVQIDDNEIIPIENNKFTPNKIGKILSLSSTFRYLRVNAKVALGGGAVKEDATHKSEGDAESMEKEKKALFKMQQATDYMITTLSSEFPETKFLFLVDADRNAIHRNEKPSPLAASLILKHACEDNAHFDCVDLSKDMWQGYQNNGLDLHSSHNYHWNDHAVGVVANTLTDYIKTGNI